MFARSPMTDGERGMGGEGGRMGATGYGVGSAVLCCVVPCIVVLLYCVVLCCAVMCCATPYRVISCRILVPYRAAPYRAHTCIVPGHTLYRV